jgi:prepilin peptidase CpaA
MGKGESVMESAIIIILTVVLLTAAYTDLRSSRIPNLLTFTAIAIGLIAHAWLAGFQGIVFSLEGLGVGLGIFALLYASGGIGAGDVKLMGAVGAMVGPHDVLITGLLAILIGGIYAVGAMCYQWGIATTGRKLSSSAQSAFLCGGQAWAHEIRLPYRLRYGLAIVGGTLLFLFGFHPFGE